MKARRLPDEHGSTKASGMGHLNRTIVVDRPFGDVVPWRADLGSRLRNCTGTRNVVGQADHYFDWSL